jgi:SAM-dependent methyltransferase
MGESFEYIGNELELFSKAENWKAYFRSQLAKHIRGNVLEVGAGLGGTTTVFESLPFIQWTCLEPDAQLLDQLSERLAPLANAQRYQYKLGTLDSLNPEKDAYDAILYIDVLEHIEEDRLEVQKAVKLLKPGGQLIILSPAYQYLFSPFDAKIGHFRRYTLSMLKQLTPPDIAIRKGFYLDSVGLLASLANKLFLKASLPTPKQIRFWDNVLVRLSYLMDVILFYRCGRSVIIVWEKPNSLLAKSIS